MPTSYGCPMKCKFCASATIDDFSLIDTNDLMEILDRLYKDYDLYNDNMNCGQLISEINKQNNIIRNNW